MELQHKPIFDVRPNTRPEPWQQDRELSAIAAVMGVSRASARAVEDALRAGISAEAAKAAGAAADVASNLGMDDAWCASEAEAAAKAAQHAITKGICSAEAAEIASEVTARARATAKQLGRNSAAAGTGRALRQQEQQRTLLTQAFRLKQPRQQVKLPL